MEQEERLWWGLAGLVGCVLGTITLAAHRALSSFSSSHHHPALPEEVRLTGGSGLWLAAGASASLVAFFYVPDLLALFGMLSVCATGFFALIWTFDPLLIPILIRLGVISSSSSSSPSLSSSPFSSSSATSKPPSFSSGASMSSAPSSPFILRPMAQGGLITATISVLVIVAWFLWQHWLLNNALGIAMCVLFVSLVRVPSLKVSAAVFGSLFLYDIFWVFYSDLFFGKNVMLTVATHETQNPAAVIAEQLHLDVNVSPSLQLPGKIIVGPLMIGLGDIVVPGLLASFTMRFGIRKTGRTFGSPHYLTFMLGYAVGILASFAAVIVYQVAQPALLYIVPATLGALVLLGIWRGELLELWDGFESEEAASEERYNV